jgi:hypothetical protein
MRYNKYKEMEIASELNTEVAMLPEGIAKKNKKRYKLVIIEDIVNEGGFSLIKYFGVLDKTIQNILLRAENDVLTYDILDTEKSKTNKLIALKEKQRQMKIGEIWQEALGNYDGCINLKIGHETGLDILSHTKKLAIELKNRTNTDNASSKKTNFDKLANYKKKNPDYVCIYANINADTENKTLSGSVKKILHNGVEIEHYIGYEFLKMMLGDETDVIIEFVKNTIDKYT